MANTPKILCEITGHLLSSDFPHAEFWEYCCTCNTFSPSKLDKGEKARSICFSCQNEISNRFICTSCKTTSSVSNKAAKGQSYFITEQGIGPSCPGCGTEKQSGAMLRHDCREAEATFLTALDSCPFCLEKTVVGFVLSGQPSLHQQTGACPNCHAVNPPSAIFCGKCKYRIRADIEVANPGSDISKTQALGSLCPNCSTPVPPGFPFCGECGQAVKMAGDFTPPPPPPPPATMPNARLASPAETSNADGVMPNADTKRIGIVVGGLAVLTVVITIAFSLAGERNRPGTNSSQTPSKPAPVIIGTPNTAKSDSRIGKTGRLTRDINLRSVPGGLDASQKVGTQYKDARVKILDITPVTDSKGNTFDWYRIQVTAYGKSMDGSNGDQPKDPGSVDVGWIHSYPNVSLNSTEQRAYSIIFDN
jgi:hypothetical protein